MLKTLIVIGLLALGTGCVLDQKDPAGDGGPATPGNPDSNPQDPWVFLSEPRLPADSLVRDFAPIQVGMTWEYQAIRNGERYSPPPIGWETYTDTSRILYEIETRTPFGDSLEFSFRKRIWKGDSPHVDTMFACKEVRDSVFCPISLQVNGHALDFPWHFSHTLKGQEVKPVRFGDRTHFLATARRTAPDTQAEVKLLDGIGMVAADIDWRGQKVLFGAYHVRVSLKYFNGRDILP
jgi:hypothetical protein